MIIQDEDDLLNSKDPPVTTSALRYPPRAAGRRPFSPLPDYETSQALASNKYQQYENSFYTSNYVVPWVPKTTSSHFVTDIYNFSSSPANGVSPVCNAWSTTGQLDDAQNSIVGEVLNTVSSNGRFSITSNASYTSNMNVVLGDLFVGINYNTSVTDTTISVKMQASNADLFDQTLVCFALSNNATGLAIYIPDNMSLNDQLLFNITLLYPQSPIAAQVDTFATYLPLFAQTFDNFGDYVNFGRVSIEGPISRIFVGSLEANHILVETSLESIFGQFAASRTLSVSTIQAPININASLFNDPDLMFPTYFEVNTGNSNLTANVILNAPNTGPPQRPNFVANIRTFYGQATASFIHDPTSPPTAIKLRMENDLGPVYVMFDQYFQGIFQANAKLGTVSVIQGTASSLDPFNPTLARNFLLNYVSDTWTYGWIGWGPNSWDFLQQQIGEVVVDTSIANCTLFFDG
ncbi:hypothetical protein DFJ58DRAFT_775585 [Suillus subalutaceus]|uniref:uncharacterized protein n=1 Tax=Suillus subalutaceus TaxID=48586 RepID=UPI001B86F346|nr:uncharacterized protein DFJ58DRAFT_775585 [Suillus subalutaceus]KAG1862539.1 hypothetical protein DFJ58DRAFT_775585 [Suillus subalutaceus]